MISDYSARQLGRINSSDLNNFVSGDTTVFDQYTDMLGSVPPAPTVTVVVDPRKRLALNVMHKLLDCHVFVWVDYGDSEEICECGQTRVNPTITEMHRRTRDMQKLSPYVLPNKSYPIDDELTRDDWTRAVGKTSVTVTRDQIDNHLKKLRGMYNKYEK